MVLLVATEGRVRVNSAYQDKVTLPNYPAIPATPPWKSRTCAPMTPGSIAVVMHGIEDSQATLEVVVKGESLPGGDPASPTERPEWHLHWWAPRQTGLQTPAPPPASLHLGLSYLISVASSVNVKLVISISLDFE